MAEKSIFETLNAKDVGEHIDKKNGLSYVSWPWAMAEVQKIYPDMQYTIWRDEQGRPYIFDPELGYMVFTSITINGITHDMWLPVMDYNNNAMKNVKYKLIKGRRTFDVEPATMFDVNTAIMRCLVKNLAMFGLGLYIYAGEDLPEDASDEQPSTSNSKPSTSRKKASTGSALNGADGEQVKYWRAQIEAYGNAHGMSVDEICRDYGIGRQTGAAELEKVYNDLTSASTSNSNGEHNSEQTSMEDRFAALDEPTPFD